MQSYRQTAKATSCTSSPSHRADTRSQHRRCVKDTHSQHLALQRLRADSAARALQQLPKPLNSHGPGALSRPRKAFASRGQTSCKRKEPLHSRRAHRSPAGTSATGVRKKNIKNTTLRNFRRGTRPPGRRRTVNMVAVGGAVTLQLNGWHV